MVSAWTGSKQSFLDLDKDSLYLEEADLVSRADLIQCSFNFKLQDSAATTSSWRPFGHIEKRLIEFELWPQLETNYPRKYYSLTWYLGKRPVSDKGFRIHTGRDVKDMPDDLHIRTHINP